MTSMNPKRQSHVRNTSSPSRSVTQTTQIDPSLLDLAGQALELLGLADHIQRLLPLQRMKADRRHRRIETGLGEFQEALDDARASLRIVRSALSSLDALGVPEDDFGIVMPVEEFTVYRRGLD